ncbi:hypothetical protein ACFL6M_06450 [Candidatus Eisenbacteria bacterium]|uniref:Uncharacterized protein n=1 Tax=Eiseniibacteriota bacterium TaxID=2212470 RepID=A0ABV6YLL5_UNCEI
MKRGTRSVGRGGDPAGEWRPESEEYYRLSIPEAHPVPAGYVASVDGFRRFDQSIISDSFAAIYDHEGSRLTDAIGITITRARGAPLVFNEEEVNAYMLLGATEDGRVSVSTDYLDYSIRVFNVDGSADMIIEREKEPVRRNASAFAKMTSYWQSSYDYLDRERIMVSEFERTLWKIIPREGGSIWVVTTDSWTNLPEGSAEILDEFNEMGQFLRKVIVRKDISPEDDLVYHLSERLVVVTGGFSSSMVASGAVVGDPGEADPDTIELPAAICCELVRVE